MVGYSDVAKAYRLYDPETRKVVVGRDVIFIENVNKAAEGENEDVIIFETDAEITNASEAIPSTSVPEITNAPEAISSKVFNKVKFGPGRPKLIRRGIRGRPRKQKHRLNVIENCEIVVPQNIEEALNSYYAEWWKESMQEEYDALVKNNTWSLVELPPGQKVIGCKWVFNIKKGTGGEIQKLKSRLVAKGCAQTYGVNYIETFSPVVRYATIRMIIALACEYNLHLHQMDVSSAYLNSELHETVYMKQPEMFTDVKFPQRVLKLNKALYGLKQSGREWNEKLDSVLKNMGFAVCSSDSCVYTKNSSGKYNIIAVYVDDLLLASSEIEDLVAIKAKIADEFDVVDGGQLQHYLGMEIQREDETGAVTVCQRQYISNLLETYGMANSKGVSTPLDAGFQGQCLNESCERINATEYQSLIGALMYLAISTRPDIMHSVCKLSRHNKDPHVEHQISAKRILRYLNATIDLKLHYQRTGQSISCYVDADWGGDVSDRKSYTGFVFVAAGCVFSWESKRQNIIALSSTEAEYVALSAAAKEAVYVKKLLNEMGFQCTSPIVLNGDNQSAQHLVKNPIFHNRSKHIDVKFHHIRDLYKKNLICLNYVPTNEMLADILTKNLNKVKHEKFTKQMGLY